MLPCLSTFFSGSENRILLFSSSLSCLLQTFCKNDFFLFKMISLQITEFINNEIHDLEQLKIIKIFSVVRLTSQVSFIDFNDTELFEYNFNDAFKSISSTFFFFLF